MRCVTSLVDRRRKADAGTNGMSSGQGWQRLEDLSLNRGAVTLSVIPTRRRAPPVRIASLLAIYLDLGQRLYHETTNSHGSPSNKSYTTGDVQPPEVFDDFNILRPRVQIITLFAR